MWYLIVPPIVIVVSLLFVLWYLSRKGADPFIARKVSQLVEDSAEQRVSFSRTKNFFLRILEKTAYRFKVISLQTHNALSDITQSLKEKRKDVQKKATNMLPVVVEKTSLVEKNVSLHERVIVDRLAHDEQSGNILRRNRFEKMAEVKQLEDSEIIARPMVSEKMVHPEVSYRKTSADIAYEESLIAHISINPKDFSSYEKLGDYYLETGNVKDAKECYKQVLKLSPAERMVKIKIRRLEKILSQKN